MDNASWRDLARCRDRGPSMFFVEFIKPSWRREQKIEEARQFCERCPVRGECLDDALATREQFGIRGGLTEEERGKVSRRRRRERVQLRSVNDVRNNESLQAV